MRLAIGALALGIVIWATWVAGPAAAVGAGACVAGTGFAASDGTAPFAGANVGTFTGVHDTQSATADEMTAYYKGAGSADDGWPSDFSGATSYEGQCCRETNSPPDCFAPVQ